MSQMNGYTTQWPASMNSTTALYGILAIIFIIIIIGVIIYAFVNKGNSSNNGGGGSSGGSSDTSQNSNSGRISDVSPDDPHSCADDDIEDGSVM